MVEGKREWARERKPKCISLFFLPSSWIWISALTPGSTGNRRTVVSGQEWVGCNDWWAFRADSPPVNNWNSLTYMSFTQHSWLWRRFLIRRRFTCKSTQTSKDVMNEARWLSHASPLSVMYVTQSDQPCSVSHWAILVSRRTRSSAVSYLG